MAQRQVNTLTEKICEAEGLVAVAAAKGATLPRSYWDWASQLGPNADGWYPYTHPFNLTGHPAITVPNGFTAAGLPAGGLQLAAPWFADADLLSAAAAYEAARGDDDRRPPGFVIR